MGLDKPPKILYKYLCFKFAKETLERGRIKISQPAKLNDPFEFLIAGVTGFSANDEDTIKIKNAVIEDALSSGKIQTRKEGEEVIDKHVAANGGYEILQNQDPKEYREHVTQEHGYLCVSKNFDNILMWSHYAEKHAGIVIGFDPKLLGCEWYKVEYKNERIAIPYGTYFMKELVYTKSPLWKYEDEWRAMHELSSLINDDGKYYLEFTPDAVREVIVGAETPPVNRDAICQIVLEKYTQTRCKQAKLSEKFFALDMTEI